MRKISELLTIIRKYHAPSQGMGRRDTLDHPQYSWGMCNAAVTAEVMGDISPYEYWYVLDYITYRVMEGDQTRYLSDVLCIDCPHELSAWWDNHIAGLIKAGE